VYGTAPCQLPGERVRFRQTGTFTLAHTDEAGHQAGIRP